eukprot:185547-Chlamydomonas_euryale.AAC.1
MAPAPPSAARPPRVQAPDSPDVARPTAGSAAGPAGAVQDGERGQETDVNAFICTAGGATFRHQNN